jgi:transposase
MARAHQHSASAQKKTATKRSAESRRGLTTKIHALADALGNPANLTLTAGQIHDLACAQELIKNAVPQALIADKAYDADLLINSLAEQKITLIIPPKANRKTKRECDFALYRERSLSASSIKLSTFAPLRPATINSADIFSPQCN